MASFFQITNCSWGHFERWGSGLRRREGLRSRIASLVTDFDAGCLSSGYRLQSLGCGPPHHANVEECPLFVDSSHSVTDTSMETNSNSNSTISCYCCCSTTNSTTITIVAIAIVGVIAMQSHWAPGQVAMATIMPSPHFSQHYYYY